MLKLFFLFTIIPATELWVLFQLSDQFGFFETIWLIVLTGIIGAAMAKREGVKVIHDLKLGMQEGQPPGTKVIEGILVLVGGLMLITPGIITDLFGFSLIFPFTRKRLAPLIQKASTQRMNFDKQGSSFKFGEMRAGPAMRAQQGEGTINVEETEKPDSDKPSIVFNHPTF